MSIVVPFLSDGTLRSRAEQFLQQYHPSRFLPIPIEEIIEFDFGIDIIAMPGFSRNFEVDAFISTDLTEIRVDEGTQQAKDKRRYRFSLAHELSHRVQHAQIFQSMTYGSISEWKASRDTIPAKEYSRLEVQANTLAGLILVPPKELSEKFAEAEAHAESVGISLQDARPEAWDSIERWLASEFQVSQSVISIRAQKDSLWEIGGM